ncbi:uncharacterized protein PV09_03789 [Verruconis gallopava]|uniref:Phosphatidylethanolamine-binding protein n=1 Tax=Verruconis gallopava TaxID=253628 RepID=A0A0D1XRD5_9PEZI|nr:uncharacterized protein PV09_03789 [Verruconis gallopava]KIW05256.1 hypothetical protein PV09_03789 [Verruconis gallopava]
MSFIRIFTTKMADQEAVRAVLNSTITTLKFSFDGQEVANKAYCSRTVATPPPTLVWPGAPADPVKKYLHVNLDLDAPFASFNLLSPILHFLQGDLTVGNNGILESSSPPLTYWARPGPPPGAAPHRYVSILYEQPESFNSDHSVVPEGGMARMARMKFDLAAFEKKAGLGKPVAGAYFTSN